MRPRYVWTAVLVAVLILIFIKGGIYQTDYRFRHKHNEAPAIIDPPQEHFSSAAKPTPFLPAVKRESASKDLALQPILQMNQIEIKTAIDNYESSFKREFNPFERFKDRVLGVVNLDFNGFKANFQLIIKKPEAWEGEVQNYPILFENLTSSKAGISTGASFQHMMSTEGGDVIFHLYTPMLMDVLETKGQETANLQMRKALGQLADVMIGVEQNTSSTPIYVRRHLDPAETPLLGGSFRYKVEN